MRGLDMLQENLDRLPAHDSTCRDAWIYYPHTPADHPEVTGEALQLSDGTSGQSEGQGSGVNSDRSPQGITHPAPAPRSAHNDGPEEAS